MADILSDLAGVAEAVALGLAAGVEEEAFNQSFTPERVVDPHRELESLTTLKVDVVGRKERATLADRSGRLLVTYEIDIGLRKKLETTATTTEHDGLLFLAQQIKGFFFQNALPERRERLTEANTDATGVSEWWGADIQERGLFFSVVTLLFTGFR